MRAIILVAGFLLCTEVWPISSNPIDRRRNIPKSALGPGKRLENHIKKRIVERDLDGSASTAAAGNIYTGKTGSTSGDISGGLASMAGTGSIDITALDVDASASTEATGSFATGPIVLSTGIPPGNLITTGSESVVASPTESASVGQSGIPAMSLGGSASGSAWGRIDNGLIVYGGPLSNVRPLNIFSWGASGAGSVDTGSSGSATSGISEGPVSLIGTARYVSGTGPVLGDIGTLPIGVLPPLKLGGFATAPPGGDGSVNTSPVGSVNAGSGGISFLSLLIQFASVDPNSVESASVGQDGISFTRLGGSPANAPALGNQDGIANVGPNGTPFTADNALATAEGPNEGLGSFDATHGVPFDLSSINLGSLGASSSAATVGYVSQDGSASAGPGGSWNIGMNAMAEGAAGGDLSSLSLGSLGASSSAATGVIDVSQDGNASAGPGGMSLNDLDGFATSPAGGNGSLSGGPAEV